MRQFKLFLAFSIKNVFTVLCPINLLTFLELLYQSGMTPRNIMNHLTAIKSVLKMLLMPHQWIESTLISNYIKSITINTPIKVKEKGIFSMQDLANMSVLLRNVHNQHHYRVAFILSFMAFLRISNLVPAATRLTDPQRQITWDDVEFTPWGGHHSPKMGKKHARAM